MQCADPTQKRGSFHLAKQWQSPQIDKPVRLQHLDQQPQEPITCPRPSPEVDDYIEGFTREILHPSGLDTGFQALPLPPMPPLAPRFEDVVTSEGQVDQPGNVSESVSTEPRRSEGRSYTSKPLARSLTAPRDLEQPSEVQQLCRHLSLEQKLALAQRNQQLRWELGLLRHQGVAMRRHYQMARRDSKEKAEELQRVQAELETSKQQSEQMAEAHAQLSLDFQDRETRLAELQVEKESLKTAEVAAQNLVARLRREVVVAKEAGDFQQKLAQELRQQLSEREDAIEKLEQLHEQCLQRIDAAECLVERQKADYEMQHEQLQGDLKESQQARRLLEQQVVQLEQYLQNLWATWDTSLAGAREKLALTTAEHAEKFGRAAAEQAEKLGQAAAEHAEKLGRSAAEQAEKLGRAATEQAEKFGFVAVEQGEKLGRALAENAGLQSRLQAAERRVAEAMQDLHATSVRAQAAEESHAKVQAELLETKLGASNQLEAMRRQAEAECRRLTRQMQTWKARAQGEQERADQVLRTEESFKWQQQAAFALERSELESQVHRLRREVSLIRSRVRDGVQAIVSSEFMATAH